MGTLVAVVGEMLSRMLLRPALSPLNATVRRAKTRPKSPRLFVTLPVPQIPPGKPNATVNPFSTK